MLAIEGSTVFCYDGENIKWLWRNHTECIGVLILQRLHQPMSTAIGRRLRVHFVRAPYCTSGGCVSRGGGARLNTNQPRRGKPNTLNGAERTPKRLDTTLIS